MQGQGSSNIQKQSGLNKNPRRNNKNKKSGKGTPHGRKRELTANELAHEQNVGDEVVYSPPPATNKPRNPRNRPSNGFRRPRERVPPDRVVKPGIQPPRLAIATDGDRQSKELSDYYHPYNEWTNFDFIDERDTVKTITKDGVATTYVVPRSAIETHVIADDRDVVRICPRGPSIPSTEDFVFIKHESMSGNPHPHYVNTLIEVVARLSYLEGIKLPFDESIDDVNSRCSEFAIIVNPPKSMKFDSYAFTYLRDGTLCRTDSLSGFSTRLPCKAEITGPSVYVKSIFVIVDRHQKSLGDVFAKEHDIDLLVSSCSAVLPTKPHFPETVGRQLATARRNKTLLTSNVTDEELIKAVTEQALTRAILTHEAAADYAFWRGYLNIIQSDGSLRSNLYCVAIKLLGDLYNLVKRNPFYTFFILFILWRFRNYFSPIRLFYAWRERSYLYRIFKYVSGTGTPTTASLLSHVSEPLTNLYDRFKSRTSDVRTNFRNYFSNSRAEPMTSLRPCSLTSVWPLLQEYVMVSFVGPSMEEAVRLFCRNRFTGGDVYFSIALSTLETSLIHKGMKFNDVSGWIAVIRHLAVHLTLNWLTRRCTFYQSVFIHGLFNFVVVTCRRLSRGEGAPGFACIAAHRARLAYAREAFQTTENYDQRLNLFFTHAVCGADSKPYNVDSMDVETDNPGSFFYPNTLITFAHAQGLNWVRVDRVDTTQRDRCDPRLGAALLGIGINNCPWTFFSCQHNELSALCDRFIAKRIDASEDLIGLLEYEPKLRFPPVDMDWASRQPGKKFAGYTEDSKRETGNLYRHEILIKRELSDRQTKRAVPRMIGTSSASSNYYASALIHTFIEDFVDTVNCEWWLCTYFMSCDDIAEYIQDCWGNFQTFVSLDGARMDAHIDPTFNDVLCATLTKYPGGDEGLRFVYNDRELDARSMHKRNYKFTAHADNGLSSGVQWTAANHCYYMYLSWCKFRDGCAAAHFILVCNKGDDLLCLSPYSVEKTTSIINAFRKQLEIQGLTTTVDFTSELSEAEFLSCRLYFGRDGKLRMVPKIGRLLAKLCWTCYPYNITDPLEYSWCLGKCLEHLIGLDIVGPFVEKLLAFGCNRGRDIVDLKPDYIYKSTGSTSQCKISFRIVLQQVYGLTLQEIFLINDAIERVDKLPAFIYVECFNKVLLRDWTINNPRGVAPGITYAPDPAALQPCSVYQAFWTRSCANNDKKYKEMSNSMCNEMIAAGASVEDAKACQKLVASGKLTENGMRWLCTSLCCHPKSGGEMPPGKWPGSANTLSTLRTIQRKVVVTQPQTLANGTWNIVLFYMPYIPAHLSGDSTNVVRDSLSAALFDGDAVLNPIGGLTEIQSGWNVISYSGDQWANLALGSANLANFSNDVSTLPEDTEGPTTLVSTSLVMVYTGQTLIRDGNLTAATLPGRNCDLSYRPISEFSTTQFPHSSKLITSPALVSNELTRYPQARTWHASEAVYMQPTCYDLYNNYSSGEPYCLNVFPTHYTDTGSGFIRSGWSSTGESTGSGKQTFGGNVIPWTQPQCFVRGLTANTEFTVTVRYVIQSTPDYSEAEEIVYAQVPAPLDLRAFKIYSMITSGSPMIFPYRDNPTGSWFRKVVSSIAKYAPLVSDAVALGLGQPEIAFLGNTAGTLAGIADEYLEEASQEEMPPDETPHVSVVSERLTRKNSTKNQRRERNIAGTELEILKHMPQRRTRRRRRRVVH